MDSLKPALSDARNIPAGSLRHPAQGDSEVASHLLADSLRNELPKIPFSAQCAFVSADATLKDVDSLWRQFALHRQQLWSKDGVYGEVDSVRIDPRHLSGNHIASTWRHKKAMNFWMAVISSEARRWQIAP